MEQYHFSSRKLEKHSRNEMKKCFVELPDGESEPIASVEESAMGRAF